MPPRPEGLLKSMLASNTTERAVVANAPKIIVFLAVGESSNHHEAKLSLVASIKLEFSSNLKPAHLATEIIGFPNKLTKNKDDEDVL